MTIPALDAHDKDLPSEAHLLSFYDALRERVTTALSRWGKWGGPTAEALMLVPDVFFLMARLTVDHSVPATVRKTLGGALIYFLVPVDLLPEVLLGPGGYLDDVVLASAVLAQALGPRLEEHAERHWSGRGEVRAALAAVVGVAEELLGERLYSRLARLLAKRGFRL